MLYTIGMNHDKDPFVAYIMDLLHRHNYSMREGSLASGLSDDAIGTILRRWPNAKPRPGTLQAIAEHLGGDTVTLWQLAGIVHTADKLIEVPPESPDIARLTHLTAELAEQVANLPNFSEYPPAIRVRIMEILDTWRWLQVHKPEKVQELISIVHSQAMFAKALVQESEPVEDGP